MKKYKIKPARLHRVKVATHVNYPDVLLVPIKQGMPKESVITVSTGQKVARGDLIARKDHRTSQNHHSAVGGEIVKHKHIHAPSELSNSPFVEVKFGGHFSTFTQEKRSHSDALSEQELMKLIENAGIFDLDVGNVENYLSTQISHNKVMYIVVNAIEFSPYLILEEKILQLHSREIAIATKIVSQLYNNRIDTLKCIIHSNIFENRHNFLKELRNMNEKHMLRSTFSCYKTYDDGDFKKTKNIDIVMHSLSRILNKSFNKNQHATDIELSHAVVVLRPSTLLAIYEAVIYEKPYIDLYIQTIIELKNTMIQRVPLGMPLLYSLFPYNKTWNDIPRHRLFGAFMEQNTFSSFIAPVVKDKLHYWSLFDESFALLNKRLQRWMS